MTADENVRTSMTGPGGALHSRLRHAFAVEAASAVRYSYFAQIAEIEGHAVAARLLTEAAQSAICAAHGHLDLLQYDGDPVTGQPLGDTQRNLAAAVSGELRDATEFYPELVGVAHDEGSADTASWFNTLAALKNAHVAKFDRVLIKLTASPTLAPEAEPWPT